MRDYSVSGLLEPIVAHPAFGALAADVARARVGTVIGPLGLPEAARPPVVAALARSIDTPIVWVVSQPDEARALAETLRVYDARPERVHLLPAPDALPFERIPWDPATREQRMATLAALYRWTAGDRPSDAPPIVVASLRGIMVRTLPPAAFGADSRVIRTGERVRLTDLARRLMRLGYASAAAVTDPGQFAHRGGIVDLYPPCDPVPTRLEWFGDEIESMRRFDPTSQRSLRTIGEIVVIPAAEALPGAGPDVAATVQRLQLRRMHPIAESEMRGQLEHLAAGERFPGIEFYGPLLHPEPATATAYLPPDSWFLFDDLDALNVAAQGMMEQADTVRTEQVEAGELPPDWPAEPLVEWRPSPHDNAEVRQLSLGHMGAPGITDSGLAAAFGAPPHYAGRIEEAVLETAATSEKGSAVAIVTRQAPRVVEMLAEVGIHTATATELDSPPGRGGLAVVHGTLGAGWTLESPSGELLVLTDGEIFGWRMPYRRRQVRRADSAKPTDFFAELTPGDHVVHIEHGIGLFRGLSRMQAGSAEREYLQIEYAQGDMLYVPTHQADRVARYVGTGDVSPNVTRLGTADWERAKKRARRAVEDIARELLDFYARREATRRTPFGSDTTWQAEMEAAFPFVETDDQMRAIEDVKRDMESERPMDRLVVGDVGFGKTEVALRAAFKAVMAGKQVAVLAPTTVLAQQHLDTFRQRMAAFPVRVEMLSRYRSRAEQREILDRLASRELDIVVGTHRLLSPDIKFHDLGLLIVDEEHRFGVKHKERLRQLREDVDTLTLTATPIPRTMHMALSGLRDLTTIDTPPDERLPVVTHIGPQDDNLIRQAIRRELGRRGQVYFVYNRVRGIEFIARKVQRLVPEARVGVAHGQMNEGELARAMLEFVGGTVDVLVCTSIIESGLDIQNANTLIVERADRFGLAQLHQLRGRVGRSAQRAYAYLFHPPGHELAPDARRRLEALAEARDLGSGFRLAMRDLEIRGAGEILGARQHGQVATIGLDLYTRLLAEAINKLHADGPGISDQVRRELAEIDPGTLPTIDLPLDAHLPESYIGETSERTRLYRRMAIVDDLAAADDLASELKDRFGQPPREVANLIGVLRLRVLAHLVGARGVGYDGRHAVVRWAEETNLDRSALKRKLTRDARIGRHQVSVPVSGAPEDWLQTVHRALERIAEAEPGPTRPSA